MTSDPADDRSPLARAFEWSTQLTTIALEMALPPAGGYWLDKRLGTSLIFVTLGSILGFAVGMIHLLRITRPKPSHPPQENGHTKR